MLLFKKAPSDTNGPPRTAPSREAVLPELLAADDASLAQRLAGFPLKCPLCDTALVLDSFWQSPHFRCRCNHSYSNIRTLIEELHAAKKLPPELAAALIPPVPRPLPATAKLFAPPA